MTDQPRPPRFLHLFTGFGLSGATARAARLMSAWGERAVHTVVSADPTALGARERIAPGVAWELASDPPPLAGRPAVARYEAIARAMRPFDLVLTYGWGAIDGVMARRVFGRGAPPLVHHEDGFDDAEGAGLKRERSVYRRLALPAAATLCVPSRTLEGIALSAWRQPAARVRRITPGIATAAYAHPDPAALPGLERAADEVVIGAVAPLVPAKNLALLVRACGGLRGRWRLVIVGEGPDEGAIRRAAALMGVADRVLLPGPLPASDRYTGLFDVAALASGAEQFPLAVMEAMAAGRPVVAPAAGDVAAMVDPANAPFIADVVDEVQLRDRLQLLIDRADVRAAVGGANRARALAEYDEGAMIAAYAALYGGVLGRPGLLG